jgi:cellulose synthase/poly-beta-1,6-N-acetylglucosamine synthase-like glycosyltransferase
VGGPLVGLALPFEGLPPWAQALFYVVFVLILAMLAWTIVLFVSSRRAIRSAPDPDPAAADSFLWVFLVPALDEEVTIADSVKRLLAVEAANKAVLVVDDGSTDRTAAVLAGLADPELEVVRRMPPEARTGKAAALNAGWRHLDTVLSSGRWAGWPRERVVVVVVDADGRLDPDAPAHVAGFFADPQVGGLQVLVRIYNRRRPLTWCQDVEFTVFGLLYQAGRTPWGTAGMGGNGQFNRLAALDSVADPEAGGPWRHRLTEDQDLGLRLLGAGWRSVSASRTDVSQQGLPSLRRLLRQRTRWAQGNLQAMAHLGLAWRAKLPLLVRLDLVAYLLQPVFQALVGVAFAASIVLWIFDVADFWGDHGWIQLLFFFFLGYGGVLLGCIARGARRGPAGIAFNLLITPVYAAYSWLIWPVLASAASRQALRRRDWSKTARRPIGEGE